MTTTARRLSRLFQHTAARRRLVRDLLPRANLLASFNTQPPEGGWTSNTLTKIVIQRFNTQPPEGGWFIFLTIMGILPSFNTQPPEGGW